jgi:hypothetical protein
MANDFEVGRVVAVDTAQVTVELNRDLRALTRSTPEGVQEVGRINSYVIMPVGAHRLVAMVTRVVIAEEAEVKADRTMVTLPSARRLMKATLIGTIDGQSFTQGVSLFPVLDNPVIVGKQDSIPTSRDTASPSVNRHFSKGVRSTLILTRFSASTQRFLEALGRENLAP